MKKQWKTKVIPLAKFEPSEERRALYDKYWAEAQTRQRSSSENFDKSILTYSSSGLAISLTFLKDLVPIKDSIWPSLLYFSWACFVLATGLTILSFLISYKAQELSIEFCEEYFMNGKDEFRNKETWHGAFVKWSNIISGLAFVLALIATSFFVKLNLDEKIKMNDRKIAQDGMPPALMQKIRSNETTQRGLPTASMPRAPATTPASSPVSQPSPSSPTGKK